MNSEVTLHLDNLKNWSEELKTLRRIVLDSGLYEEFKWKQPCYTYNDGNVLLLAGFKEFCTISFFKGVLLKDPKSVLVAPGKNSQSVRMMKFKSSKQIEEQLETIKDYIQQAIEVEKSKLKVEKTTNPEPIPVELQSKFEDNRNLKTAFEALTKGRQRGYIIYFSDAKHSKNRTSRIKKYETRILNGKGINDCVCGKSKRYPNCDGSHNSISN